MTKAGSRPPGLFLEIDPEETRCSSPIQSAFDCLGRGTEEGNSNGVEVFGQERIETGDLCRRRLGLSRRVDDIAVDRDVRGRDARAGQTRAQADRRLMNSSIGPRAEQRRRPLARLRCEFTVTERAWNSHRRRDSGSRSRMYSRGQGLEH